MLGGVQFPTTQWTTVLEAASSDARRTALSDLCVFYWPSVYAFIRREVRDSEQAKDLTQAFFLRLLDKHDFPHARLERARFSTFLLSSVKHFLSNEWDRQHAQKRGGGQIPFPLEFDYGSRREPADTVTPERVFERHWATMLLNRSLRDLRQEFDGAGKGRLFKVLVGRLTGDTDHSSYAELGARLNISEGAVKVAVHRMRARFRQLLREEIAQAVSGSSDVDEELRYLVSVLSS